MQPTFDRLDASAPTATARRSPRRRRTPPLYILLRRSAVVEAAPSRSLHAPLPFDPGDTMPARSACASAPARGVRITDIG